MLSWGVVEGEFELVQMKWGRGCLEARPGVVAAAPCSASVYMFHDLLGYRMPISQVNL